MNKVFILVYSIASGLGAIMLAMYGRARTLELSDYRAETTKTIAALSAENESLRDDREGWLHCQWELREETKAHLDCKDSLGIAKATPVPCVGAPESVCFNPVERQKLRLVLDGYLECRNAFQLAMDGLNQCRDILGEVGNRVDNMINMGKNRRETRP